MRCFATASICPMECHQLSTVLAPAVPLFHFGVANYPGCLVASTVLAVFSLLGNEHVVFGTRVHPLSLAGTGCAPQEGRGTSG